MLTTHAEHFHFPTLNVCYGEAYFALPRWYAREITKFPLYTNGSHEEDLL